MSSSVLETQRSALEELERIEQAISDRIIYNPHILPDTHKLSVSSSLHGKRKRPLRDNLIHQHEVAKFLDRYEQQCKYLKQSFETSTDEKEDSESPAALRAKELSELAGSSSKMGDIYKQFHLQVSSIRDFHRRYPNEGVENQEQLFKMHKMLQKTPEFNSNNPDVNIAGVQYDRLLSAFSADVNVDSMFSGEEFYGRFLDLVQFLERLLNLKFIPHSLTYLQYLDKFADFNDSTFYPPARLRDPEYFSYIADLHNYLSSFLKRTHPLENPDKTLERIDGDFESVWENGRLPNWLKANSTASDDQDNIQVSSDGSVWCAACAKSFKNEAVYNGHLNGNKHKKNVKAASSQSTENLKFKSLAYHEYCIYNIMDFLSKQLAETKSNVERKQALTDRERQIEAETLESEITGAGIEDSDDDGEGINPDGDGDDDVIYNPLKLPLGWDGKPIPYWLWKLNGLGIEFPCEVCGNYTYMGRKAFEKHFMEPRHTHGLKCLGVQPSPLFTNITNIKDALACKYQNRYSFFFFFFVHLANRFSMG